MFRPAFESAVEAYAATELVVGEGLAVDASPIVTDTNKQLL